MKVLLFLCVIPGAISAFSLMMIDRSAEEILVERYGEIAEKYHAHSRVDVVMSMLQFALLALCPLLNLAVAFICVFRYEELRDKTVEKAAADIESHLRNANQ